MEIVVAVAEVVVAVEIAGNRLIRADRASERGIWQQIPRFFCKTWVSNQKQCIEWEMVKKDI